MKSWPKRSYSKNKYNNIRVETDGYSFQSKLEASVYQILKLREKAGELKIIQVQDHIYLTPEPGRILYIPDFKCLNIITGLPFWVEAKGFKTDKWPLITKLWKLIGPGTLEIWEGSHTHPSLTETIISLNLVFTQPTIK